MTPSQFRKIALSIAGVVESQHMGHADFRVEGKVVASLGAPDKDWGMIKLPPGIQESFCQSDAGCFQPCQGAWGRQGYTNVRLAIATTPLVRSAFQLAIENFESVQTRNRAKATKVASSQGNSKQTKSTRKEKSEFDNSEAVDAMLRDLAHPLKPIIKGIRATIIQADKQVTEGIKWNAPSFYCRGWFATINLRAKSGVVLVLHHGAKVRRDLSIKDSIDDPSELLNWASSDRATVTFMSADDFAMKQKALQLIVKRWVKAQLELAKHVGMSF